MDPLVVKEIADVLETIMIVSFGVSWPMNLIRSYRSRSTKGKSILFNFCILFGYICGLASKFLHKDFSLAFWFYFPNIIMVTLDIMLYYHNRKLEHAAGIH